MSHVEPGLARMSPGLARVGRAIGVFRHLCTCARRPERHSPDEQHACVAMDPVLEAASPSQRCDTEALPELSDSEKRSIAELLAVRRHLEVRWQLFNEALFKFCDVEAMLAICTDDVTWTNVNGNAMKGKDRQFIMFLKSMISRKLFLVVDSERLTRVSQSGALGLTLDKDGKYGRLTSNELCKATTALNLLLPNAAMQQTTASEYAGKAGPLMILENNIYTLRNVKGEVVEQGKQAVLWEQHNATWYIRGNLSFPLEETVSM